MGKMSAVAPILALLLGGRLNTTHVLPPGERVDGARGPLAIHSTLERALPGEPPSWTPGIEHRSGTGRARMKRWIAIGSGAASLSAGGLMFMLRAPTAAATGPSPRITVRLSRHRAAAMFGHSF